jgi:hypothetical protein
MPISKTNLRIQVLLNGENQATAGLLELGVLDFRLSWIRRDPALATENVQSLPGFSWEQWQGGDFEVALGGLDATHSLSVDWFDCTLAMGDQLTIRILPPGEFDPPSQQKSIKVPKPLKLKRPLHFETFRPDTSKRQSSGENPRLEVTVNDRVEATAGVAGLGSLRFGLDVKFSPALDTAEVQDVQPTTAPRGTRVQLDGFESSRATHVDWLARTVEIGDVLVLRVLPPGEIDAPSREWQ